MYFSKTSKIINFPFFGQNSGKKPASFDTERSGFSLIYYLTSGSPLIEISNESNPESKDADATIFQST